MSSLISNSEKAAMEVIIGDVADTFSRPLVIVKQAKEIVISENANNSFIYESTPFNTTTLATPVTGVFQGRIWYERKQPMDLLASFGVTAKGSDQSSIQVDNGFARLKLNISGANFIADAERVQFDGNIFTIESTPRPHGLFTPQYYTYWLKKTN